MLIAVRIWILFSTLMVLSGWALSYFHELNRGGYLCVFALGALTWIFWLQKITGNPASNLSQRLHKFKKRCRRPAPFLFMTLLVLSLAAGLLYIPMNGDSNAYRITRILHWLGEQQWHWIHTLDDRMNIAGCGFEWVATPFVLFTRTDRYIFLVNWLSYAMLPGLIFSVFRQLRISPRVSWWWTWILAAGWCYVMQASSDVNDSFAVIYALAAVDLGLRAAKNQSTSDFCLSILSVALLTGAKQTSIPLAAMGLIALWHARNLLLSRPLAIALTTPVAVVVSALPLSWLNWRHTGVWTGITSQVGPTSPVYGTMVTSPLWAVIGNLFCLPLRNLEPPIFPWANSWDHYMHDFAYYGSFGHHFLSFESFGSLPPAISETNAGIGMGISFLAIITLVSLKYRGWFICIKNAPAPQRLCLWLMILVPYLLLLVFMSQVGTRQNPRQLAPYYVFLFPLLLINPFNASLVRRCWWRGLALLTILFTVVLIILARSRPLFPSQTFIAAFESKFPHARAVSKNFDSFFYRPMVENVRTFIAHTLPPGQDVIGYATDWGGAEPTMWLPVGSRRVERILPRDSLASLRQQGIQYIYVDDHALTPPMPAKTIDQWMADHDASMVAFLSMETNRVAQENRLYLVKLNEPGATNQPTTGP